METNCYCIYCKNHPKHTEFKKEQAYVGSSDGFGPERQYDDHKAKVTCFKPDSHAADELDIDLEDFEWENCWYDDGIAGSFVHGNDFTITGYCENEDNDE